MRISRAWLLVSAAIFATLALPSVASAADITGTWDLPPGSVAQQTWNITSGTGTLAGEGHGGSYTWPIEGTLSGNSVQVKTAYRSSSYVAYFVGTVSADGKQMSGTWDTTSYASAASSSNTWLANLTSGGGGGGGGGGTSTRTDVHCNRGPDPGDPFTCTAAVFDTGATPSAPGGSVTFSASNGGSFSFGPTCTLTASSTSPSSSSCSVTYVSDGPTSTLTAKYPGDSAHAPSSGTFDVTGSCNPILGTCNPTLLICIGLWSSTCAGLPQPNPSRPASRSMRTATASAAARRQRQARSTCPGSRRA